jgi:hypothetical protein
MINAVVAFFEHHPRWFGLIVHTTLMAGLLAATLLIFTHKSRVSLRRIALQGIRGDVSELTTLWFDHPTFWLS